MKIAIAGNINNNAVNLARYLQDAEVDALPSVIALKPGIFSEADAIC